MLNAGIFLACVASVPVRSECNHRAKESFGQREKWGEKEGRGEERRERLPANSSILKNAHWFSRLSSFTDRQLCHRAKIKKDN